MQYYIFRMLYYILQWLQKLNSQLTPTLLILPVSFSSIFYFFFLGGYTVILYSEGMARDHQTQCMGVYRSTGYHNGRPVYKQDEGENYLFYHNHCWLIGPQVGKDYAWIRNPLEDQRTKKSSSPSHSTRSHIISKFSHKKCIYF